MLPASVRDAAIQLLALRPMLDSNLNGDDIKQAFMQSGLFLETRIAATVDPTVARKPTGGVVDSARVPTPQTAQIPVDSLVPAPSEDLKAALAVFRQVLTLWLEPDPTALTPTTAAATTAANLLRLDASLPGLPTPPPLAPAATGAEPVMRMRVRNLAFADSVSSSATLSRCTDGATTV